MNNAKRKKLNVAINLLNQAKDIIDGVVEEEQEGFDNMTEGLQQTEKGQAMEDAISNMNDAIDTIDEAISAIEDAAL